MDIKIIQTKFLLNNWLLTKPCRKTLATSPTLATVFKEIITFIQQDTFNWILNV